MGHLQGAIYKLSPGLKMGVGQAEMESAEMPFRFVIISFEFLPA